MNDEYKNRKLALRPVQVEIFHDGHWKNTEKQIANEVPIAFSYSGTTQAVMMATPSDLEDFAVGFSFSEELIHKQGDIRRTNIVEFDNGIDIQIDLMEARNEVFFARRRHMAGPVGCGLCGIESLDAALRRVPKVETNLRLSAGDVASALQAVTHHQVLNDKTRAAHAAGFFQPDIGLRFIREDVGRHNALDKLSGALLRANCAPSQGVIVVTSRLSVEMVQKTAMLGCGYLIAVSAPTLEAIEIGRKANITLIGRARGHSFEVYNGAQRLKY